jgi:four helix bundle protein
MKPNNIIRDKSFLFSLDIIKLYKVMLSKNDFVLSKQVIRSGTSIGANVNEAQAAQSKRDFVAKMSISSKEARETLYWLELLKESKFVEF